MKKSIGLLFDLDGVIIDSEKEYSRIWHNINEIWPTGVADLEHVIKGCTLSYILDNYFTNYKRDEITAKLYDLEGKMQYHFAPGAEQFLKDTRNEGYSLALVTSSDDKKMAHLIKQMPEILSYFDAVVTANDISRSKPDPEGYVLGAQKIGFNPEDCIVFEDSLQGISAGKNAGAKVIGIASTLGEERVAQAADYCIHDLSEISVSDLLRM